MPRVAIAFVVTLMLLTGIVLGQLRGIATVRSDLSQPPITPQKSLASNDVAETSFEPATTLSPIEAAISPRTPRLERLTIDRFAQHSILTHGGTIVAVETGELTIYVSGLAITRGEDQSVTAEDVLAGVFRLEAGDSVAIAPHASYRLSNNALQSSRLLILTVPHFDRASEPELAPARSSLPPGVNREETVNGTVIAPDRGPYRLDLYRVAPPEIDLASFTPPNSALLFVAGERLLATTELSSISEAGNAQEIWIVTISELVE